MGCEKLSGLEITDHCKGDGMNARLKPFQLATAGFHHDLQDLRARIAEAVDEIAWIESAPLPKDEIAERLAAAVDREAARFEAGHRGQLIHGDIDGVLIASSVNVINAPGGTGSGVGTLDVGPMLCWLLPDHVKARLATAVDALDFESGPPLDQRPGLSADAQQRKHAMEVEEECMTCEGEEAGLDVPRRADADPAVILGAHEVHVYKFKAVPKHGEYHFAEIEADEMLTRGEIMTRARHALPDEWTVQHELESIEILEPIDSGDILPGDDLIQQQPAQRARARPARKMVASPYLESGGLNDPALRSELSGVDIKGPNDGS